MIDPLHRVSNADLTLVQLQANVQQTEAFGLTLTDIVSVTYNGVNFNAITFDWKMPNPGPYTTVTAAPAGGGTAVGGAAAPAAAPKAPAKAAGGGSAKAGGAGGAGGAGAAAPTFSITRQLWVSNVLTSVVVSH